MATKRARSKLKRSARARRSSPLVVHKAPFIEHIYELRRRLFSIAVSVVVFSTAAYFVQQYIVKFLLAPAGGQQFAQTTPGGGFDFLFRVCLYTGIAFSVPVIFHQFIKYLEPLIRKDAVSFIRRASFMSWLLALAGIGFGYFIGLPAALHFLLHQFSNPQIQTLINIQSYLSFVLIYLVGAAMLFQIPLVMLVINKIKPLKPSKLFGYERWVILFAAIAGGILSPSPNIMDQILLAGPMIATYQIGILLVWLANRKPRRPKKVAVLLQKDAEIRQQRLTQFESARAALHTAAMQAQPRPATTPDVPVVKHAAQSKAIAKAATTPAPVPAPPRGRNTQYLRGFQRRPYLPGRVQL